MSEMRGILEHQASFMESFGKEPNMAVLKVPYTAVGELRCATRGSFGEVRFFHQKRAQSPGNGFDGGTEPRRTAANDQAIPDRRTIRDRLDCQISVHDLRAASIQASARPTTLCRP